MEYLNVYDNNKNKLDKKIVRGDKLSNDEHILVAVIFIKNKDNKYLIQKTSLEKSGLYSTTGGHVLYNEDSKTSIIREVKEELGIDITNDDIKYIGSILFGVPFGDIYYLEKDIDIDSVKLQKEEVSSVSYMTKEEIDDLIKKGHSFKDLICPDSLSFKKDHFTMGNRFGRVLFLKNYASYIKDSMIAEFTDINQNNMLSIDIIPVQTDEAVKEVENRLLGVETNITNWQRRQNANNNFSAVIPFDLEQQRKESKEFLEDLTTRDQRMMFAVLTLVITADTKEQLENDTETILSIARKHLCQVVKLVRAHGGCLGTRS